MDAYKNDDILNLVEQLARADSEEEVIKILSHYDLWESDEYWKNFGGVENNFGSAGNQQSGADAALVEKLINAIDAVFLKSCLESGIDPESIDAPRTIADAANKFYGVEHGSLFSLSKEKRNRLAEDNIGLVASGSRDTPCYTIFDRGCGQAPDNFESTFLSLLASNKIKIPFVQGKFNMGSTGALIFCGKHSLQLIISKEAPIHNDTDDRWGVTVIRRERPTKSMKSSKFTYLAPSGKILSFTKDAISLLPSKSKHEEKMRDLEYGSFIKLYDYAIGPGLKTVILFDLFNRLNLLMPNMAFPIRLYERRDYKAGHSFEATLAGLHTRMDDDRQNNLEADFPSSSIFSVDGKDLKVRIFAFKDKEKEKNGRVLKVSGKENYAKQEGIVFCVNGQAHGFLPSAFFNRKSIGMGYIKNSILVTVECSSLENDTLEELFMSSRDRLREGSLKKLIEKQLESIIASDPALKELKARKKAQAMSDRVSDNKPLANILSQVIKSSKTLSTLLLKGERLSNPSIPNKKVAKDFKGKRFPTFYNLNKKFFIENPKDCEQGREFRINCTTDVESDYFTREIEPGKMQVCCNEFGDLESRTNIFRGRATTSISLHPEMQVGGVYEISLAIEDSRMLEPIKQSFFIKVMKKVPHNPNPNPRPKPRPKPRPTPLNVDSKGGFGLPEVYPVSKDQWGEHEFDQNDALRVVYDDGRYDFFYNEDNIHLKTEQKSAKDEFLKTIETQYKTALVLIGLSIIDDLSSSRAGDKGEVDIEAKVKETTRALSPVLLPIIRELGGLEEEE